MVSPAGQLVYGFLTMAVEDGMRRRESNSTFTKYFQGESSRNAAEISGGVFLGGLFYCKTPMGANKIFYCAVSRVERKKKSHPLTISPSQKGLWFACFLAKKSSISAENFKSPTWLLAHYKQPDRASLFCGFGAGQSHALGNCPECSIYWVTQVNTLDPASPPRILFVRSTGAGQTPTALPVCNPMSQRNSSYSPWLVQQDHGTCTCKYSTDPLANR